MHSGAGPPLASPKLQSLLKNLSDGPLAKSRKRAIAAERDSMIVVSGKNNLSIFCENEAISTQRVSRMVDYSTDFGIVLRIWQEAAYPMMPRSHDQRSLNLHRNILLTARCATHKILANSSVDQLTPLTLDDASLLGGTSA